MTDTLIIFARKPELGKVKTRLAKATGAKKALEIYSQLLQITINIDKKINCTTKIYWSEKINANKDYYQRGIDIGERMYNALSDELDGNNVCLIGTDTPLLTNEIIEKAFLGLKHCEIVFGPAKDGGYYLVGVNSILPKELFLQKLWSHKNVLNEALEVCKKLNLKVKLMPTLLDIDTIEDYNNWKNLK